MLLDSTETIIDLLDNVGEYLKCRRLFPSKTWFFLQSSELLKPSDYDFNLSDSEELPERFTTSASNTRKQKICPTCACIYEVDNLHCETKQLVDREKAASTNSNKESSSSPGSGSRSTESVLSPNRLREK